ncbi:hypothetical protein IAU60_006029 [Kwoniella sp. DSM 27419]
MIAFSSCLLLLALAIGPASARTTLEPAVHQELLLNGRPQVGLWKALLKEERIKQEQRALIDSGDHSAQTTFSLNKNKRFGPHCFTQKVSHFDPAANGTFCQRYWIDASAYKEGGPVFLLDGGETSGANRVPFLETGILQILSNATNGIGIVLEHRYYGDSVPVESFSTDDLRYLNNAEALEDSAYFIKHFKAPASVLEISEESLRPNNTAWIYYGGSYAGARAAHMRTQYPDLVWGAIASSAVTHAQVDFPQYYDPIQRFAPPECISALQEAVTLIDDLLDRPEPIPTLLKGVFGLEQLQGNDDFADVISSPLGYWQAKNWDPAVGSTAFYDFCDALTAAKGPGQKIGLIRIPETIINYGRYIKAGTVSRCPRSEGNPASDIEDCFGTQNATKFQETDLDQTWRLWLFQVCTQWGYFMPAPPAGLPSILSSKLTLDYTSKICRQGFLPGKHFQMPEWPDVEEVNQRGDYGIEYDRLAFIDGDRDPWRPMTPQSDWAPKRNSSVNKPVHLIFDGVHHYDENGLSNHAKEPFRIRDVHALEVNFVSEWVAQFAEKRAERIEAAGRG